MGRRALEPSQRGGLSTVVVNGREHDVPTGETVAKLLDRLGLGSRYALVERNGEPLERERYDETALQSGDRLVVARPVAGG
jgi:thiamine biosynthesis protein ThiS